MATMRPAPALQGPTLDVQVLEGLETYIATEQFLHKLEQAGAEWIDLSEHQHHPSTAQQHKPGLETTQVVSDPDLSNSEEQTTAAHSQPSTASAKTNSSCSANSYTMGLFGRWIKPLPVKPTSSGTAASCRTAKAAAAAGAGSVNPLPDLSGPTAPESVAASTYEVVEQQPPLHLDLPQQEAFVMVSSEDAIEGMAYYIALYLSRAPEAKHMDPKQLQAALKQTMTSIRRSRYRLVWDWGRALYRWGAISYSALQLYEHPWVVRALMCAIWTSSKMAVGLLL